MNVQVTKNNVTILSKDNIHEGEYKVNELLFEFSEEYTSDLVVNAVFTNELGKAYQVSVIDGKCHIPAEILADTGQVVLGVYAYQVNGEELELRYSPFPTSFVVLSGSYDLTAEESQEITPTQYEQYMQALQDGLNQAKDSINELNKATDSANDLVDEINQKLENDEFIGPQGPKGDPGEITEDTLDNVIPKQTATDSIINVNDALKYKTFNFKVDGNYEQKTSDGSNLLNIDYSINPVQGEKGDIQASLNDDYSFTVTGQRDNTEYSNIYFNLLTDLNIKQGVQYYTHDLTLVLLDSELNWIKNQPGNFIADGNYIVKRFYWATNKTGSINEIIRPYFGTVPYDESKYYKYTGGIASPNPDYSQDITSLNFDKITKIGQNLLPNTFYSKKADYSIDDDGWANLTFDNSDGTSNQYFNLFYDSAKLKPNKNYNVILEVKELSGTGTMAVCSNAIFGEQKEGQFSSDYMLNFSSLQSGKIYNKICLTKTDLDNIVTSTRSFVQADPGQAGSITFRISILEDTSVTPENFVYQPYQETNYLIDLQGNEMVSLPNGVKDELQIDKEGNVNLIKKVGKKVINGSEEWMMNTNYTTSSMLAVQYLENSMLSNSKIISDHFTYNAVTGIDTIRAAAQYILIGLDITEFATVDDFKNWLQSNNTTIYYQLAEPQTISLGKLEDLISTDKGANTFIINGNIDTQISTTYALDIKKYIDNKIAQVSQAIVEGE